MARLDKVSASANTTSSASKGATAVDAAELQQKEADIVRLRGKIALLQDGIKERENFITLQSKKLSSVQEEIEKEKEKTKAAEAAAATQVTFLSTRAMLYPCTHAEAHLVKALVFPSTKHDDHSICCFVVVILYDHHSLNTLFALLP